MIYKWLLLLQNIDIKIIISDFYIIDYWYGIVLCITEDDLKSYYNVMVHEKKVVF